MVWHTKIVDQVGDLWSFLTLVQSIWGVVKKISLIYLHKIEMDEHTFIFITITAFVNAQFTVISELLDACKIESSHCSFSHSLVGNRSEEYGGRRISSNMFPNFEETPPWTEIVDWQWAQIREQRVAQESGTVRTFYFTFKNLDHCALTRVVIMLKNNYTECSSVLYLNRLGSKPFDCPSY